MLGSETSDSCLLDATVMLWQKQLEMKMVFVGLPSARACELRRNLL